MTAADVTRSDVIDVAAVVTENCCSCGLEVVVAAALVTT